MNSQSNNSKQNIEEDEIDLKELFSTIWNNKFKIIFFSFLVTVFTILYTLSKPNVYTSSTMLVPQGQAKSSLGGLGALAGMAGIDIGGSSQVDISTSLNTILNDFTFQKMMIEKYKLDEKIQTNVENLQFALNYNGIYLLLNDQNKEKTKIDKEKMLFDTFKSLSSMISISSDKKSGIITLSSTNTDRFLAKELVEIYLIELTSQLRKIEMSSVNKQLEYYTKELSNTDDINIKEQLGQMISGLVQKKVLSMANTYYTVNQFTLPQVAYVSDKSKPKRGLIVVVSFITSIILGIFIVFFLEFLRNKDEEK